MHVDYIIVGQGISGTWLSYYLQKEGRSVLVIDNNLPGASSRIAAGIINPVTGRRHVTVWMADQVLPFSLHAYEQLGAELGQVFISRKNIIDLFPTAQMRLSFVQRVEEKAEYVSLPLEENSLPDVFNYEFGFGKISPVYTVHLETFLPAWRKELVKKGALLEESFDTEELRINDGGISYGDTRAEKIIFCDGNSGADRSWFKKLPFAPNKGEALIVRIPGLMADHIYKKGMMLVPLADKDHWWVGSSYEWDFENALPTKKFRDNTEAILKNWLKIPFTTEQHLAAVRPATLERRPFVGLHPLYPAMGILNGMGTKGCSLAPFFAKELADHLCYDKTLNREADIHRFQKILSRNNA